MGSLEVIAIGDATEEWILLLLVVEFVVIAEKNKGIDLKNHERQPCILSCLAALVDFIRVHIQVRCSSRKDIRVTDV